MSVDKAQLAATVASKVMELTKALHEAREHGVEFEIRAEEVSIGNGKTIPQVMAYLLTTGD